MASGTPDGRMLGPVRIRIAISAAVLAFALLAATAIAVEPRIVATPSTVHRGGIVRVHGSIATCPIGDTVTLISHAFSHRHDFAGVPAIFARVGAHHAYSIRTRIPVYRTPGRYSITGRCGGGNLGVAAPLRVLP
jgi:hypothetical protein